MNMAARSAGFTLIEVLLSTMLLAAGLTLGFATLRAAGATAERGEAIAARNERMRAVSTFLRNRIGGAQGIVFNLDEASGQVQRFAGDAHSMRFVADLPDYLGRGGPHLHELSLATQEGTQALQVDFRMVVAGEAVDTPDSRPPEPLADGLRSVTFAYRTNAQDGQLGAWQPQWDYPEALPLQVRVDITDTRGPWPTLLVSLPHAANSGIAVERDK
ncbi:MAG: general secretion pathway protein GspJ [Pseudomonadota bacterium]|nr:general secretion pathway protein GspJ [Pseudomonadota bacterium]